MNYESSGKTEKRITESTPETELLMWGRDVSIKEYTLRSKGVNVTIKAPKK